MNYNKNIFLIWIPSINKNDLSVCIIQGCMLTFIAHNAFIKEIESFVAQDTIVAQV